MYWIGNNGTMSVPKGIEMWAVLRHAGDELFGDDAPRGFPRPDTGSTGGCSGSKCPQGVVAVLWPFFFIPPLIFLSGYHSAVSQDHHPDGDQAGTPDRVRSSEDAVAPTSSTASPRSPTSYTRCRPQI